MSNKRCELPTGSFRRPKKGYEEIHVPALKAKPVADDEEMIKISDMPDWTHNAFKGMKTLNRVQSRCSLFAHAWHTHTHMHTRLDGAGYMMRR